MRSIELWIIIHQQRTFDIFTRHKMRAAGFSATVSMVIVPVIKLMWLQEIPDMIRCDLPRLGPAIALFESPCSAANIVKIFPLEYKTIGGIF